MAAIDNGPSANQLAVNSGSKGARIEPVDALGVALNGLHGTKPANQYGAIIHTISDGVRRALRGDRFGSVAIAKHQPRFTASFEGATLNPLKWLTTATTMTATQADQSGLTLNSGAVNAAGIGYLLQSSQRFLRSMRAPQHLKIRARANWQGANAVMRIGLGDSSTFNGGVTSGAYFEIAADGAVTANVFFNGSTAGTVTLSASFGALLNAINYYVWEVILDDDSATFTVHDTTNETIIAETVIQLGATGPRLFATSALPVQIQMFHSSATTGISSLIVSDVYVAQLDQDPLTSDVYASFQMSAEANPFTGVQTANAANSTAPTNATLNNTVAGYATLGGRFGFAAVTGAVTDFALFGFQVPAGRNLRIRRVIIDTINTGAAVATTPTVLDWALATQLTAVSLATASHARVGLGMQSLAIGAAIGATANTINVQFDTPLVCGSSRFVDVILRLPVGTATAGQVVQGNVTIVGEFY